MLAGMKLSLGAIYLGNLAAAIFYGITCVQTFTYYQLFDRDRLALKLAVFFLWILDTLQMAMVSHTVYVYAVSGWSNPVGRGVPLWTFWVQIIVTTISDFVIRCIYGTRIWILGNKNIYLMAAIALSALFVVAITFTFAIKSLVTSDNYLNPNPYMLYLSLGSSAVVDIVIASILCVLLFKNRTNIKRTDSLLNTLILYTVCTGMLTGFYKIVLIIIYAALPTKHSIFVALFSSFSKMYFNALLASLNARYKLRENTFNGDTIVFDTLQFASPVTSSPSRKVYVNGPSAQNPEHFTVDISSQDTPLEGARPTVLMAVIAPDDKSSGSEVSEKLFGLES